MALDSLIKRASALNFVGGRLLPPPDGTIDQGDRQTFVGFYSGILAEEAILWTTQPEAITNWTNQTASSDVWTEQTASIDTWTPQ